MMFLSFVISGMFIQPGEKGECFPLFPPNDKDKNKGEIIMAKKDKI